MSTIVNTRSPWYIKEEATPLSSVTLNIYVWEGTDSPSPYPSAVYTLDKDEIYDNDYVVFEIAELVRDYLDNNYNSYSTKLLWVQYSFQVDGGTPTFSSKFLACNGYSYFEEGKNARMTNAVLMSNDTIFYNEGEDIIIPINAEEVYRVSFGSEAGVTWESVDDNWEVYNEDWGGLQPDIIITDNGNSNQKYQYITISSSELFTDQDKILFYNSGGTLLRTIYLDETCEPKYTPYKVTFVNKYGALQDIWFFKKSIESINTQSQSFKRNTFNESTYDYSINEAQYETLDKTGREQVIMNTGFVNDDYVPVIRELMLSERVWLHKDGDALPVKPTEQSMTYKTSVNDKVSNYTITFEYAFDKINSIR